MGGWGPTEDDRTRHALATSIEQPLVESASAWRAVQEAYAKVKPDEVAPLSNRRQALLPDQAAFIPNDRGTAPGIWVKGTHAWFAAVPGVPSEMKAMVQQEVLPLIQERWPHVLIPHVVEIPLSGMGESKIQDLLGDLLQPTGTTQVGITASDLGHCLIRVMGEANDAEARAAEIRSCVGTLELPHPDLARCVVEYLEAQAWRVTTAESCTCGHIVARLGAVPGASAVLHQAQVTYHNEAKKDLVGVPEELLQEYGAVSEPVVRAMALGAIKHSMADVAIASSGIAGPGGGSVEKPVGTVWLAVAVGDRVITRCGHLRGGRLENPSSSSKSGFGAHLASLNGVTTA